MKIREIHLTLAMPIACIIMIAVERKSGLFWYIFYAAVFFMVMFIYGYLKSKGLQGNDKTGFRRVIFTIGKSKKQK
jgi:predicted permease